MSANNTSLLEGTCRKFQTNKLYFVNVTYKHNSKVCLCCFSEPLCPAIITDLSYNGTFINGQKIGKGNSQVLDDNDVISVTHELVKSLYFVFYF